VNFIVGYTKPAVPFDYHEYRAPANELNSPQGTTDLFFGNWNGAAAL